MELVIIVSFHLKEMPSQVSQHKRTLICNEIKGSVHQKKQRG